MLHRSIKPEKLLAAARCMSGSFDLLCTRHISGLGTTLPSPKKLDDIMKLDTLADKSPEDVEVLWMQVNLPQHIRLSLSRCADNIDLSPLPTLPWLSPCSTSVSHVTAVPQRRHARPHGCSHFSRELQSAAEPCLRSASFCAASRQGPGAKPQHAAAVATAAHALHSAG